MTRVTQPFPRSADGLGRDFSLRDWPKAEPPSRPPLDSAIDSIMRTPPATQPQHHEQERHPVTRQTEDAFADAVRRAADGELQDPSDALAYLDKSQFTVGDDGTVDQAAVSDAVADLIARKPYLAAPTSQLTGAHLDGMTPAQIVQARQDGRLQRISGAARAQDEQQVQQPRWKRDAERRIAGLKLDNIEQVTPAEYALLSPEQMVRAQREGRLTQILATPNRTSSDG